MSDSGLAESAAAAVNRNAAPAHVQNLQIEKTDIGNNKLTCASIRRRAGGPQPGFALFRTGRDGATPRPRPAPACDQRQPMVSVGQKVSQVHGGRSGLSLRPAPAPAAGVGKNMRMLQFQCTTGQI